MPPAAASGGWPAPEGSISLQHAASDQQQQQPGTSYHSAGTASVGGAGSPGQEPDVFSSPMLTALREGRASSSPEGAHAGGSGSGGAFQFATARESPSAGGLSTAAAAAAVAGQAGAGHAPAAEAGGEDDDGASSGGESEATVSEAAVVARTLTRASALQKDREALRQQVHDLSHELRELKGRQGALSQHMQAAAGADADADDAAAAAAALPAQQQQLVQRGTPAGRRQRTPVRGGVATGAEAAAEGGASLAERCRLAAVEERHLRSELETLNRKVRLGPCLAAASTRMPPQLAPVPSCRRL